MATYKELFEGEVCRCGSTGGKEGLYIISSGGKAVIFQCKECKDRAESSQEADRDV